VDRAEPEHQVDRVDADDAARRETAPASVRERARSAGSLNVGTSTAAFPT
jgi:hypothetical protein